MLNTVLVLFDSRSGVESGCIAGSLQTNTFAHEVHTAEFIPFSCFKTDTDKTRAVFVLITQAR